MRKIISRVRDLSQKAAQLKAAVEGVHPKIAGIRDAVAMSAGELHRLRADVQSAVSGLRIDNEDGLTVALTELNDSTGIFQEAGYTMEGVELELSPVQRLIVHLQKFDDVAEAELQRLLAATVARRTTHAVLASLIKAEQVAGRVSLTNLRYRELTIHVGPVPTVRLCWRTDDTDAGVAALPPVHAAEPPPVPGFARSSFFESRAVPHSAPDAGTDTPPTVPAESPAPIFAPQPAAKPAAERASPSGHEDWRRNALDRFKKMPDLSKLRY